jgi:hypothetical protein
VTRPGGRRPATSAAVVLTVLTLLFLARVAGQALVMLDPVPWLPPPHAWYSGLLPYSLLLPAQLVILAVQAVVSRAAWMGSAWLVRPKPRASVQLTWLAAAYALAMAVRYAVTGTHAIPVVFHWILAAYLYTLARLWRPAPGLLSASRTPRGAGR